MAKNTMTFTDNRTGKSYEYNIIDGTRGPSVVDISTFYKDSGMFTFDPGYTSTAACESKITFIDGENSELKYRGYDIADLAGKHSFLDVSYLLMNGRLPTKDESKNLDLEIDLLLMRELLDYLMLFLIEHIQWQQWQLQQWHYLHFTKTTYI
jgi:citrate synthase